MQRYQCPLAPGTGDIGSARARAHGHRFSEMASWFLTELGAFLVDGRGAPIAAKVARPGGDTGSRRLTKNRKAAANYVSRFVDLYEWDRFLDA